MNDLQVLTNVLATYGGNIASQLFGIKLGAAGAGIMRIGIDNMMKKHPYKYAIDFLTDENGNFPDKEQFFAAMKEMLDDNPIVIHNVKFNKKDIEEIEKMFNDKR